MKKNIKFIPLFLFLFVFQLLYFLSTIYTEKIDHMFLILAVFMVLICILLYCVLSDVLKKSNAEMELAFLQKQKQLKQEQDYSLQIRRQDTRDFQTKTVQELLDFQILLEQGKYEQADTAIRNLNQTFQKKRFHPYCQNNLLQAILEGKRLRAEQEPVSYTHLPEIFIALHPEMSQLSIIIQLCFQQNIFKKYSKHISPLMNHQNILYFI